MHGASVISSARRAAARSRDPRRGSPRGWSRALLVAPFGPPRLAIERAELLDDRGVGQHQEARRLAVAAAGRLASLPRGSVEVVGRDRVGAQAADRPLGEDRLADRHGEARAVHRPQGSLLPSTPREIAGGAAWQKYSALAQPGSVQRSTRVVVGLPRMLAVSRPSPGDEVPGLARDQRRRLGTVPRPGRGGPAGPPLPTSNRRTAPALARVEDEEGRLGDRLVPRLA